MQTQTELTLTVRLDTSEARREITELKTYAFEVIEQIRAAYASLGPVGGSQGVPAGLGEGSGVPDATTARRV